MAGVVELWWLGQSSFRLRPFGGAGPTVFVDPYLAERETRTWRPNLTPAGLADQADVILCTHEHLDHFDRATLRDAVSAPRSRFCLVVPTPLVADALALGLPDDRVVGLQPGETWRWPAPRSGEPAERSEMVVLPVPARHGLSPADAYTFGAELSGGLVRYLGFVVELAGVRVYLAGDTVPYPGQVERLRSLRPQLALLPINGRDFHRESLDLVGNLDPREAAHLAAAIGATTLVPTHFELFEQNQGFPGDLVGYVARFLPHLTVIVPGRGGRFVFAPEAE